MEAGTGGQDLDLTACPLSLAHLPLQGSAKEAPLPRSPRHHHPNHSQQAHLPPCRCPLSPKGMSVFLHTSLHYCLSRK